MTTLATYIPVVGADRIVSIINDAGTVVPVDDVAPAESDPGNRLIYLIMKIDVDEEDAFDLNDVNIDIKVKLPAGIIRRLIQTATAEDNLELISPILRILPYLSIAQAGATPFGGSVYDEHVSAMRVAVDYTAQTMTIRVKNLVGQGGEQRTPAALLFGVEINWNHSSVR